MSPERSGSQAKVCGDASESPPHAGGESAAGQMFPWLLRQKITVPERVAGHVHRAALVSRAMPTRRRLTVLKASGGFGKITLLAECCRRLRQNGVPSAWVSLDERDEAAVLEIYIAFACHSAGLDLFNLSDLQDTAVEPENRIGLVVREIQETGRPFVIAFDELERLGDPTAVSLLAFLLQRGPANLHLAIACRGIPHGLDVAGAVLDGRAEVLTTDELRFSTADVARFFDLNLSRSELAAEMERSFGWPIALQVSRAQMGRRTEGGAGMGQELVENWMEFRLLAGFGQGDRDFLLDLGLFGWMDAALLDEVLQRNDSWRQLDSMHVLAGLLESNGGRAGGSRRLHPLVREHCAERRFRENPQRFRAIHRRIAEALVRRGDTVSAMRHAIESGDPLLAGEILERAGGVRLWVHQGLVPIRAADRCLSMEVIRARPRLALVRCLVLLLSGRPDEARSLFREAVASPPGNGNECSRDFEHSVDECIVRGAIALYGAEPVGSNWTRGLSSDYARLLESRRLHPITRAHMEYALCVLHQLKAEFDVALGRFAGARLFLAQSQYMTMHGELLLGQVAMAQGHVQDAESHYRRAQRRARKARVLDPVPASLARVMLQELALECGRASTAEELRSVPKALMTNGVPFSALAAAGGVVIEVRLRAGRADKGLAKAEELLAYARGAGLTSLARYLAVLRISVLAVWGRIRTPNGPGGWRICRRTRKAAWT